MCGYPPFWAELDDKKTEMMIRRGNYSFPQQVLNRQYRLISRAWKENLACPLQDWAMVSDGAKTLLRELLKMLLDNQPVIADAF